MRQTISFDLALNDLGYEYSQDGVCLNSFDCVFVYEKMRCTNETKNYHYQVIQLYMYLRI